MARSARRPADQGWRTPAEGAPLLTLAGSV
jgi:hypothetical protein